jgi:hypothetical protein
VSYQPKTHLLFTPDIQFVLCGPTRASVERATAVRAEVTCAKCLGEQARMVLRVKRLGRAILRHCAR